MPISTATSRESIFQALFAAVSNAQFSQSILGNTTWAGKARKWVDPAQVANEAQPFLAQFEGVREIYKREGNRLPAIRTVGATLCCWARVDSGDTAQLGSTYLNIMLEAVEQALQPDNFGYGSPGLFTLGGLVQWCRIEGNILRFPGDSDNQAMIAIPVLILWP